MRLSERLIDLEMNLAKTMTDFQELKNLVTKLEQENERLRGQLSPHNLVKTRSANPEAIVPITEESLSNEGHDTLVKLYEEGYHVCHLNFGQEREGECLFCLGFLSNANA